MKISTIPPTEPEYHLTVSHREAKIIAAALGGFKGDESYDMYCPLVHLIQETEPKFKSWLLRKELTT